MKQFYILVQMVIFFKATMHKQWYVSYTGEDIPKCGTITSPCQTIEYALQGVLYNSDEILLTYGYYETCGVNIPASNSSRAITIHGLYSLDGQQPEIACDRSNKNRTVADQEHGRISTFR